MATLLSRSEILEEKYPGLSETLDSYRVNIRIVLLEDIYICLQLRTSMPMIVSTCHLS